MNGSIIGYGNRAWERRVAELRVGRWLAVLCRTHIVGYPRASWGSWGTPPWVPGGDGTGVLLVVFGLALCVVHARKEQ